MIFRTAKSLTPTILPKVSSQVLLQLPIANVDCSDTLGIIDIEELDAEEVNEARDDGILPSGFEQTDLIQAIKYNELAMDVTSTPGALALPFDEGDEDDEGEGESKSFLCQLCIPN